MPAQTPRHLALILVALAAAAAVATGCNSSETNWQDDVSMDAVADTSTGSDTSGGDTSASDTSEPDTTGTDTSASDTASQDTIADAADTSTSDTDGHSDTADMTDATDTLPDGDMVEPGPRLVVDDQVLSAADTVVVREVEIETAGWIAIYDTTLGTGTDAIIGSLFLDGTELVMTDVAVTLDRALADGEVLAAALFVDAGQSGVFEPDTDDVPATDATGNPVGATFTVSYPVLGLEDQTLELSTVVEVAAASLAGDGWLVLHPHAQMGGGQPDTSIALAAVPVSGVASAPIEVVVSEPLTDGARLWAALYHESGDDPATFDASVDLAVIDLTTTDPLVADAIVTVPDGTAAVRITVVDADETTGVMLSAEPAELLVIDTTVAWPTLELEPGWRYELFNPAAGEHPLEIVNDTVPTVLLSQGAEGTLEADATVAWSESGDTARFTVSATLAGLANGYRCGVHTDAGSGEVVILAP